MGSLHGSISQEQMCALGQIHNSLSTATELSDNGLVIPQEENDEQSQTGVEQKKASSANHLQWLNQPSLKLIMAQLHGCIRLLTYTQQFNNSSGNCTYKPNLIWCQPMGSVAL